MALGARVSPELIVFGAVSGRRVTKWDGEITGTQFTVDTDGGPLTVKWRARDEDEEPGVGQSIAVIVSAFDGERGSSLTFERYLSHGDVDLIVTSALGQPVKA